jgi:hypothetical protein
MNPNSAEGNPNSPEGNPNLFGRKSKKKRKEIQTKSFHFLRRIERFQGLTPTPTAFFLFEADSGFAAPRRSRRCAFAPGAFAGLLVFVFGSSDLLKQVKGWRRL